MLGRTDWWPNKAPFCRPEIKIQYCSQKGGWEYCGGSVWFLSSGEWLGLVWAVEQYRWAAESSGQSSRAGKTAWSLEWKGGREQENIEKNLDPACPSFLTRIKVICGEKKSSTIASVNLTIIRQWRSLWDTFLLDRSGFCIYPVKRNSEESFSLKAATPLVITVQQMAHTLGLPVKYRWAEF